MALSTPVAFLIFNRPDLTEIVFEAIAQAKPKKLLVVADGPRLPEEVEKCEKAKAVINRVNWDCEVLTNFSEKNLGCKHRVSSGLDWVFSEVEEAIILEDDCLPAPSFFYFCQTLLERYRYDERIMMISGDNFQPLSSIPSGYSYYFSKYTHIWGWASWRRAWLYYDIEMRNWSESQNLDMLRSLCQDSYEQKYWSDIFNRVRDGNIDTWDYQWLYACWRQGGLTILPNSNLVSNIGFGTGATHTTSDDSPLAKLPTTDIWEIKHPSFVVRNKQADNYTFDHHFGGKLLRKSDNLIFKVKYRLKLAKDVLKKYFNGVINV